MLLGAIASAISLPGGGSSSLSGVTVDNTSAATALTVASQVATDSPLLTASIWFRTSDVSAFPSVVRFAKYPIPNNASEIIIGIDPSEGDILCTLRNPSGSKIFEFWSDAGAIVNGVKNHIFMACDTNHGAGAKLATLKLNGADVLLSTNDSSTAFNIAFNGFAFGLPKDAGLGPGWFTADFADVWIGYGQYETDVTKFRNVDGSAVDLGADGSGPTGTPPIYFFTGGASTFGTNAGSGDTVSVTGTLQDATL